jgi:hypothetical protein
VGLWHLPLLSRIYWISASEDMNETASIHHHWRSLGYTALVCFHTYFAYPLARHKHFCLHHSRELSGFGFGAVHLFWG